MLILNHTPQDECSLERYHPKLWASTRRIYAKPTVWNNLRDQIFHRNKIEARGSIRKAPNVIWWTISLDKLAEGCPQRSRTAPPATSFRKLRPGGLTLRLATPRTSSA